MCGILLVKSKDSIPLEKHLDAFEILKSRGPDFSRYRYENNIFIGHTVLHITGDRTYYDQNHKNFLAYNGEIYNAAEFGYNNNDIEFVYDTIEQDISNLKNAWGMWAWVYLNNETVLYASDPQGEKALYQYTDDSILIVCSEVSPILEYIENVKVSVPYTNKGWNISEQTPWAGIKRIIPGVLYQDCDEKLIIDSIFNWRTDTRYNSINEAYIDFKATWGKVIGFMIPNCSSTLSYSGGLDSNLILNAIPNLNLCSIDIIGKDPITGNLAQFLTDEELSRLTSIAINPEQWAREYLELQARSKLPVQSWSHVGKWIVNKHCQDRVLFTGLGADELFGGYRVYKSIKYSNDKSHSPYSKNGSAADWNKCMAVYNDPKQATLLMDYLHQVVSCDAMGTDYISGAWGIETRNPFMSKPMIQLAMNLPFEYKVGQNSKPLIRQMFLERWNSDLLYPKVGFAGHANDSLKWLDINLTETGNRQDDWKRIATETFYGR